MKEICSGCGKQIDTEVCWCGSPMNKHTYYDNHPPIPFGCDCFRHRKDEHDS
jgi:hypothetical protein